MPVASFGSAGSRQSSLDLGRSDGDEDIPILESKVLAGTSPGGDRLSEANDT